MKTQRAYDLPTRIFHWVFGLLFLGAFVIAKTNDDESARFPIHMLLGITLVFTVVLRIVWGLIGTQYAKFTGFSLKPRDLFQYGKNIFTGKTTRQLGHNPASSWAALTMMALTFALGTTGYLMTQGTNKDFIKEIHELLANAFLVVVALHIAGVVFHTLRHKDGIGFSMIHGKKLTVEGATEIPHNHVVAGVVFALLIGGFGFQLKKHYDPNTRAMNFFGKTIQLGEMENEQGSAESEENEHEDDD